MHFLEIGFFRLRNEYKIAKLFLILLKKKYVTTILFRPKHKNNEVKSIYVFIFIKDVFKKKKHIYNIFVQKHSQHSTKTHTDSLFLHKI